MNSAGLKTKEEREAHAAWLLAWEARQKEFVLHSERITGEGFDPDEVDEEFVSKYWEIQEIKDHLDIAKILNRPGGKYVGVYNINSALLRRPNNCLRTGIRGMSKGLVPEGKDVPRFLELLDEKISDMISLYKTVSSEEKDMRAWEAHDEVLCLELFKDANARTGRLVYNHVRTLFGLDTFVIRFEKSVEYYANLQRYRHETFLPGLPAREVALRKTTVAAA